MAHDIDARHSIALSTARHDTAQHGTTQHSTARHGMSRHDTAQYSTTHRGFAAMGGVVGGKDDLHELNFFSARNLVLCPSRQPPETDSERARLTREAGRGCVGRVRQDVRMGRQDVQKRCELRLGG